jgi:hypothetical protein
MNKQVAEFNEDEKKELLNALKPILSEKSNLYKKVKKK